MGFDDEEESWKRISHAPGYEVSSRGRIRTTKCGRPHVMKQGFDKRGYPRVCLYVSGKVKTYTVHRLVAEQFIDNPSHKQQVNHRNGVKTDNSVHNLEWVTCVENIHAFNPNIKLTESDAAEIRELRGVFTQRDIATVYGISQRLVWGIQAGHAWGNVT